MGSRGSAAGVLPPAHGYARTWRRARPRSATVAVVFTALVAIHELALGQGPRWSSPLLLGDHLFGLLVTIALLWYAYVLGLKLGGPLLGLSGDPLAERLSAVAIGLGLLSTAILGAGFLRLYHGPLFLVAWLGLTVWLRSELAATAAAAWGTIAAWGKAGLPSAPTKGQRAVMLVLTLVLAITVVRTMVPLDSYLFNWDGLAYHLAAPKIYIERSSFVPLPDMPLANAPSGSEMLYIPALLTGVETIGGMLDLCFALLLALAVFSLARRHFGRQVAWLAVLVLCSTYWLNVIVSQSLTDFASTFPLVLAAADLMAWADAGSGTPAGGARTLRVPDRHDRLLLRAGLLAGLGVSYKLTSIPILPTLVLTAGLLALACPRRSWAAHLPAALRAGFLAGAAGLVFLGPWLLKNLYFFGRPFYPAAVATTSPTSDGFATTAATSNPTWWSHAWWLASTLEGLVRNFGGAGCIFLLAAPLLLWKRSSRAAILLTLIGGVLWLTFVVDASARYYLLVIVMADVLAVASFYELARRLRLHPLLVDAVAVTYLLVNAVWVLGTGMEMLSRDRALPAALGTVSAYSYVAPIVRPYAAEQYADEHTPPGAMIAMVGDTRGFYLDRPYLGEWYGMRLTRLEQSQDSRQAELALWCRAGVRYVVFDRGSDITDNLAAAGIRDAASFAWLRAPGLQPRVLFSAHGVDVLAVQPCRRDR